MVADDGWSVRIDAYAVLGVEPGVDDAAVRRGYRRVAALVHPDRGGDPAAFRIVAAAYARIATAAARAAYGVPTSAPVFYGHGGRSWPDRAAWEAELRSAVEAAAAEAEAMRAREDADRRAAEQARAEERRLAEEEERARASRLADVIPPEGPERRLWIFRQQRVVAEELRLSEERARIRAAAEAHEHRMAIYRQQRELRDEQRRGEARNAANVQREDADPSAEGEAWLRGGPAPSGPRHEAAWTPPDFDEDGRLRIRFTDASPRLPQPDPARWDDRWDAYAVLHLPRGAGDRDAFEAFRARGGVPSRRENDDAVVPPRLFQAYLRLATAARRDVYVPPLAPLLQHDDRLVAGPPAVAPGHTVAGRVSRDEPLRIRLEVVHGTASKGAEIAPIGDPDGLRILRLHHPEGRADVTLVDIAPDTSRLGWRFALFVATLDGFPLIARMSWTVE